MAIRVPRPVIPRTMGFLVAAALCDGSMSASLVVLALWLDRDFGAKASTIGTWQCLPSLVYLLAAIPLGHLGDRAGVRRVCLLGLALAVGANLWLATCGSPAAMLLPLAFRGIGPAMFWPSLGGWLSRGVDSARLPRRMAVYNLGWSTGTILGTSTSGVAYHLLGGPGALRFYSATLALAVLITWRLPSLLAEPGEAAAEPGEAAAEPEVIAAEPSTPEQRRLAWLAGFGSFFVASLVRSMFPQFGRQALHLPVEWVTAYIGLVSAVQTLAFVVLGVARSRWASGRLIRPTQVGAILGLGLLATNRPALAAVAMVMLGLQSGVAYAASQYHSLHGRDDAARQTGINEAVIGFGGTLGPLAGGLAAELAGPHASWLCGMVVVAACLAVGFTARRGRARVTAAPA